MKKTRVVLFEKGETPRVFINPPSLAELQARGDILVNPSIPKGISPDKWRLINGKIRAPMKIDNLISEKDSHEVKSINLFKIITGSSIGVLFYFQFQKQIDSKLLEVLKALEALLK